MLMRAHGARWRNALPLVAAAAAVVIGGAALVGEGQTSSAGHVPASRPDPHTTTGAAARATSGAAPPTAARATPLSSVRPTSSHLIVGAADDAATGGYWLAATNGGVFSFGAPFYGSAGALSLTSPVIGVAAPSSGTGYWMDAADGGVFSYGSARFYGSMGGTHLNQPVVGMAAAPDGQGYWLVAADGGIFSFGSAHFYGSMGGTHLNQPIVAMAAAPDGHGYWMVAADGGIFSFGTARFAGSMGGTPLASPVVSMTPVSDHAYRMVAADGGLFSFGAPFAGSAVGHLARAAVAMSSPPVGYRVVSADGTVLSFGGAPDLGSVYVPPLVGQIVAIDPGHNGGNGSNPAFIGRPVDGGGFIESCDTVGTETASKYSEHAFNFDVATRLAAVLRDGGATVVLTRTTDSGVGPCVPNRAAIGNAARATAAISIHGDGGPVTGRGFQVIEPLPVVSSISDNRAIVSASIQLGASVRTHLALASGEPPSTYAGSDGIVRRSDLGGLNLSTVPKVLVECANMQNSVDAAAMQDPTWRQRAAQGLADGITSFLASREIP